MGDTAAAAAAAKQREEEARAAAEALNRELTTTEEANAAIHAQAIGVMNIKVLVPVTLDKPANNYGRWRSMFLVVLGKYNLKDHVLSDASYPDCSAWAQMDCCVLTWVYCTISNDLQQVLMIRDPAARDAWLYLEDEFLEQRESRALLMEAEFRSFKQGDMSITDYCRRLETMAASLKEFGDPIGDRQLVLTLLRGLNAKFRHMVSNLKMQRPFPTFSEARALLLLEEIDINDLQDEALPDSKTGTKALVMTQQPQQQRAHTAPTGFGGGSGGQVGNGGNRNRRRGCGRNDGNKGAGPAGPRPGMPLPTSLGNPWSGSVQLWPHGNGGFSWPHDASATQLRPAATSAAHDAVPGGLLPASTPWFRLRRCTNLVYAIGFFLGQDTAVRALESHGRWALGPDVPHQQLQHDVADAAAQLCRVVCRLWCRFAHDRPLWYTLVPSITLLVWSFFDHRR
jgi:hypothetical protein